jgi:hypothetical protein
MIHDLLKKLERLAMAMLALGVVVGCTVSARTGTDFDPSIVGSTLKPGVASQADVRAALGEPFAKGSAMMPFHDRPHLTWTYFCGSLVRRHEFRQLGRADEVSFRFLRR